MKKLFFLLFFVCCIKIYSQQEVEFDKAIVHYKDGSVFIGNLVKQTPERVWVLLSTADTIRLQRSEIKKLKSSKDWIIYHKGRFHFTKGYFGQFHFGLAEDDQFNITTQINLIVGKRLDKKWSVGLGGGIETSDRKLGGDWVTHQFGTIFGYGRYYLSDSRIRTYVDSRLGYGFDISPSWMDPHSGGINMMPGIGLHFASKKDIKWYLGLGRYIQYTSGNSRFIGPFGLPVETDYKLWYQRTMIRIGFEFK